MGSDNDDEDQYSAVGDKGEIGFIDYNDDRSVCSYNPVEEGPIVISVPFPFLNNHPQSIPVGSTSSDCITIKNTTSDPVDLWAIKIYGSNPEGAFTLSLTEPQRSDGLRSSLETESLDDRVLQPGETLSVWVSCKPKEVGQHTSAVHFDLEDDTVERVVVLLADDSVSRGLASRARYTRGQRKKKHFNTETFVTAPRVARANPKVVRNRMPRYDIPRETREILETKVIPNLVREGLSEPSNYVDYFKTLVIMEELQLEHDMSCYHMENVRFGRRGSQFLSLEVPGLAERRPSLVHGDYIFAKLASHCEIDTSPAFQGSIHRVESDEIHLRFAPEFHMNHRDGDLYNVQFTYNRVNMRRLYQAIDATVNLDHSFLFPTEQHDRRQINRVPLVPISRTLNEEQTCSVEMILGCEGSPPYVIHGPPGTGKTITLVEAILQVCKSRKRPRILVCAPSNSAADHILERLIQVNPEKVRVKRHEIFRLNASARPSDEIDPELAQFCFLEEGVFTCPSVGSLAQFKIIISTYMCSSVLHAEGLRRGHFSHIFLDEAGQASEPEAMISVANFCLETTVVVLAGDPLQLGPVIYSKEADSHGLGKSYLERIFKFEPYDDMDYNYATKLVRNYRCHQEILHLPSELFYEGELIACREETSPFMRYIDFLPSREFPVLFFGIQGCDEREGSNPSWFNRFEVSKIIEVVKRLTKNQELSSGDIGVITPYRQQVTKIKTALENMDWTEVKVGSVEQFQGQEKQVIIVSTVRSTIRHNEFDKNHCLGFLSNPRRFNVAITRAISLLIIIGNPHIISKDPYWNMLLWRCIDNNSYRGCDPPKRQEVAEQEPSLENDEPQYQNQDYGSSRRDVASWVEQASETDAPDSIKQSSETERLRPRFEVPPDFPEPTGWGDEL